MTNWTRINPTKPNEWCSIIQVLNYTDKEPACLLSSPKKSAPKNINLQNSQNPPLLINLLYCCTTWFCSLLIHFLREVNGAPDELRSRTWPWDNCQVQISGPEKSRRLGDKEYHRGIGQIGPTVSWMSQKSIVTGSTNYLSNRKCIFYDFHP